MNNSGISNGVREAGGVLDRIVRARAERLEREKLIAPVEQVIEQSSRAATTRRANALAEALSRAGAVNVIAEVKRCSPSKGIIREDFDPIGIARSYRDAGAAAVSVLCEEDFFGGSLDHLKAIRRRVDLPLLRKDFVFDEYQIHESVVAGADAVLLIVAILEDELLARLIDLARRLRLDTLVEVHSIPEMERAGRAGARIIGVNNRDLTTLAVDLGTSIELAPLAPPGAVLVSESGLNSPREIRLLKTAGFHAFLIGEHFMRAADPGNALRGLVAGSENLAQA
ncbi:MAG TPA: indole-3-glycerol phosphate synthase TrpC [Blastocatellia bacterium]|jgi:indole-3-glycerol phosphate synthase